MYGTLQLVAWSQLLACVHHSLFHRLRRLRLRRLRRLRCLHLAVCDAGDGLEHECGTERLVRGEG